MATHSSLEYNPFPEDGLYIRTLILHAGEVRDPIRCSLRLVDLEEQPDYDALSYTWGDPSITESIEVDGIEIEVTFNLGNALRHLRDTTNDSVLWVDAVCINQSNTAEKSQQVALMGQIYRRCAQVRIWLGCETADCGLGQVIRRVDSMVDDSDQHSDPFEMIRHMAQDRHLSDLPCFETSPSEGKVIFNERKTFKAIWEGFLKVSQSTWWSRMWTVQEVILPPSGTLTHHTWSISLADITKCGTNYYNHVWGCCQKTVASFPSVISIPLDEFCSTFLTLDRDRTSLSDDEYYDIQEQSISYGRRQCQNPRDKVYGLLALIGDISDLNLWLTPDYSASKEQVFHEATYAMLYRCYPDLKCLVGTEYGYSSGIPKWASWVRDFDASLTQLDADVGSNRLMIYDLFNACLGRKKYYEHFTAWPPEADKKLHQIGLGLHGTCLGTVESVFDAMKEDQSSEGALQQRKVFGQWAKAAGIDLATLGTVHPAETIRKFWRTMLGGVSSTGNDEFSDWRRFTDETMTWWKDFISWISDDDSNLGFPLDRTLLIATHGRCYFKTKTHAQGLCYPTTRAGDEVWVAYGSNVPFILRHSVLTEDEATELRPMEAYGVNNQGAYGVKHNFEPQHTISNYYELVGDCYLDEHMDGEGVGDPSQDKFVVIV